MYYRLHWKVVPTDPNLTNTTSEPDLGVPWSMGVKFNRPLPEPIVCRLKPGRGQVMRDLFAINVPLFSDRLLAALHEVPVDNIDTYAAEIHGVKGEVYSNYKAVNILGKVACADLDKSEYGGKAEPPFVQFGRLVIDEQATHGLDLFRLAENPIHILVYDRVKQRLDQLGLVGASLTPIESNR